jgi:hypothetical protein
MRALAFAPLVLSALLLSVSARADDGIKCKMTFSMKGWSAFYKTASGAGHIKCSNGQAFNVKLNVKGGGLSVGKSVIEKGKGQFSDVASTSELFGSYVVAEAHAGAVKSAKATVMTKGEVSLALSGVGRGWDLGVDFVTLTISQ